MPHPREQREFSFPLIYLEKRVKKTFPYLGRLSRTLNLIVLLFGVMTSVSPGLAARSGEPLQGHTLPGHLVPLLKTVPPLERRPNRPCFISQLVWPFSISRPWMPCWRRKQIQHTPLSSLSHAADLQNSLRAAPETVDHVVTYLKGQGFHVESIASNNCSITASGTAATVEKAFSTTLQQYRLNGRVGRCPNG